MSNTALSGVTSGFGYLGTLSMVFSLICNAMKINIKPHWSPFSDVGGLRILSMLQSNDQQLLMGPPSDDTRPIFLSHVS
jgi:hypothetical protein